MTRTAAVTLTVTLLATAVGCVERRFVVQTSVPGAQVYVNNQPGGPSPADLRWDYAGMYEFRAVAQGYEPVVKRIRIRPKWYEYPVLDFFFEAVYPFHIEDVRRITLELQPSEQVRTDELLEAAERLRGEGQNLPPPKYPDKPERGRDPLTPAVPPSPLPPN